jgi:universal stress protein A
MLHYRKILIAVDLADPTEKLNNSIKDFAKGSGEVHICTVTMPLEVLYSFAPVGSYAVALGGLQEELTGISQKKLKALAAECGVKESQTHLLVGKASMEIKRFAKEQGFDLIVVGTHGKSAIRAALGSTSNGVLHGAPCDVLALSV